jgi:hypothetical protein
MIQHFAHNSTLYVQCSLLTLFLFIFSSNALADHLLLIHTECASNFEKHWDAKIEIEAKFRHTMTEYYDFEAMPWLAYGFTKWFKFGLGYRTLLSKNPTAIYEMVSGQSNRKISDHVWQIENRPVADLMLSVRLMKWSLEERLRTEYRCLDNKDPFFRWRDRIRIRPPWSWSTLAIQPWIAWEGYYENNPSLPPGERLNRHRFFIAFSSKLRPSIRMGCYHYWELVLAKGKWGGNSELGFDVDVQMNSNEIH